MKIDKKKAVTLFALTLLITSLLLVNIYRPTSAESSEELLYLHGPPLTPVHMHSNESLVPIHMNSNITLTPVHMHYVGDPLIDPIYEPLFTDWHELYPDFCQFWNLTSIKDNGDNILSPNDQIDMTDEQGNVTWYHVDRITWTLYLTNEFMEEMFIEFKGPPETQDPINFPVCTYWHEVYPDYCNVYHIIVASGPLEYCTYIDLENMSNGIVTTWHVEDVATDLILREKIMDPICTWWHEVYPNYCQDWHLTSWEDNQLEGDLGYGMLSPCDQIDMIDEETGNKTWYYVDRVTIALNVTLETDPLNWMKIEMKTQYFEEMYNALKHPVETLWHEVYPDYSNVYSLTWWDWFEDDNCNGVLDVCDYIWLYNMSSQLEPERYHVEDICYDIILNKKIMDPICTWWYEVAQAPYPLEPPFNLHHLTSWEEDLEDPYPGRLSPHDQVDMYHETSGETKWYHVDRVTLTLNVSVIAEPPGYYYLFEYKGPFENIYQVKIDPYDSLWHLVWPDYEYNPEGYPITTWEDNCNGVLDRCDNITLGGVPCHVEDLAIDLILNEKISNPVYTWWHELYPTYCNEYQITSWEDNDDGILSPCDTIDLDPLGDGYHVENMTLTLYVTPQVQGVPMYIEFVGGFEYMYSVKTNPEFTVWHEVYPEFSLTYDLTEWIDNCNGVLDYCDLIWLIDPTGYGQYWHVEEVAVDMVVEKLVEPVHDVAVIDVFSLCPWVYQGEIDPINVTVENQGNQIETVDVYALYDGNQAAPKQTVVMNPGDVTTLTFNWNTAGVPPGNYTVSAFAMLIPPIIDGDPDDNAATGNVQEVREPPPFYWKEGYPEYAPSGLPDFDQKQDLWQNPMLPPGQNWTWCGPTAVGNSLWWMDSRYHPSNLLTAYVGAVSEHDPSNVPPFIDHLAYLMDTDGRRTGIMHIGTNVFDMEAGIAQYLSWTGVNPQGDVNGDGTVDNADLTIVNNAMGTMPGVVGWDMAADIFPVTTGWPALIMADNIIDPSDLNLVLANMGQNGTFYEHTIPAPDYYLIEEEVERCQDVVLLIAPYYGQDRWDEEAHFVTVSGVNSPLTKIAFSDPMWDAFENGLTPEGRVLPLGVPHNHPPSPPDTTHNNASLVSHDIYNVTFNPILGMWEVIGYPGYNWPTQPGYVWVIEYAVITSPLAEEVCGVEITNVTVSKSEAYRCCPDMNVNVTVHNNGTVPINCTVSAYYYNVTVHQINVSQNIVNLAPSTTATLTFSWDLTGVTENITYTIKANVTCTCGASHEFVNGKVKVRLWGDVNGDGNVLATDLAIVKSTVTKVMLGILTTQQALAEQPFADLNCDGQLTATDVAISKSEVTKAMM